MKVSPTTNIPGEYSFFCPGCNCHHCIWTKDAIGRNAKWDFNGNLDKPTMRPSLLVRWEDNDGAHVCHSYITDGFIQYLDDCTHSLAGQKIEIPNVGQV